MSVSPRLYTFSTRLQRAEAHFWSHFCRSCVGLNALCSKQCVVGVVSWNSFRRCDVVIEWCCLLYVYGRFALQSFELRAMRRRQVGERTVGYASYHEIESWLKLLHSPPGG